MNLTALYFFLSNNRYLLPLGIIGLTLITLVLTLIPADFLGESRLWSFDKLGHLALFGSWTFMLGLYQYINSSSPPNVWFFFLFGVSFGIMIELLQHFLPLHRHGSWGDLLFDAIGCLFAILLLKRTIPNRFANGK